MLTYWNIVILQDFSSFRCSSSFLATKQLNFAQSLPVGQLTLPVFIYLEFSKLSPSETHNCIENFVIRLRYIQSYSVFVLIFSLHLNERASDSLYMYLFVKLISDVSTERKIYCFHFLFVLTCNVIT